MVAVIVVLVLTEPTANGRGSVWWERGGGGEEGGICSDNGGENGWRGKGW